MPLQKHDTEKPLVTFALFAYNQQDFITEAVEAALLQIYSPLEIILSDDCSTDDTFEVIQKLASNYHGPHKIILNRNTQNLGIGGHINHIMNISEGELIVVAAGDDISLPMRTSVLVEHWLNCNRKPHSLYSKSMVIDSNGVAKRQLHSPPDSGPLLHQIMSYMAGTQGCSHAWSREVFTKFGPLLPGTVYEDRVIPLRSELLGGIEYIPDLLVRYRIHDSNVSLHHWKDVDSVNDTTVDLYRRNINVLQNYLVDLETAKSLLSEDDANQINTWIHAEVSILKDRIRFLQGGNSKKLSLIKSRSTNNPKQSVSWLLMLLFPKIYIRRKKKEYGIN